jgi:predicted dinucleotide-binding enzyme
LPAGRSSTAQYDAGRSIRRPPEYAGPKDPGGDFPELPKGIVTLEIAILGTGAVGRALSSGWVEAGHRVTLGSRHPERPRSPLAAPVTDIASAAASAPVVVYAAPWSAAPELLPQVGSLDGQLLIDVTNPLTPGLDSLDPRAKPSAAEWLAAQLPAARLMKAFNTVSAAALASPR